MGKVIVYCQGCGTSLREEEFDRGAAHHHDNMPFCVPCRPPEQASSKPPARRSESTRVRRSSTARIPVAPPPPPRPAPAPKVPFLLGLGTGVLLTLLSSAALRSAPPERRAPEPEAAPVAARPAPEKPPPPVDVAGQLRRIEESIQEDSGFSRRVEIRRSIDALRPAAGSRLEEIDRVCADYDRRFEAAAARLAEFARTEAERLASKSKLDEAVRKCNDYLESFGSSAAAGPVRRLRDDLDRRAR